MASVTTTTAANTLASRWSPTLHLQATDEMRIANDFNEGEGASDGMLGAFYIRKILAIAASTLSAGSGASLAPVANTETRVSATIIREYNAVQIENMVIDRMDVDLVAAYKAQLAAGLATSQDVTAGILAASLSTNVVGSGGTPLDEALLLAAQAKLATNAKNKFVWGQSPAWLTVHPTQLQNLMGIFNLTAANVRGGSERPKVSGVISEALGMRLKESGNVYVAAGTTHNLLHCEEAFVKAYNRRAGLLAPQPFEDTVKYIAVVEYAMIELFDENAVDVQT